MKKLILIVVCFVFAGMNAQDTEVRKAIDIFFEGFHERDTVKMQSVFAKEIVLHSIAEGKYGGTLSVESAVGLTQSIASIPKNVTFQEKLLAYKILVDGSLAHVWTPYEFYINGKLSHSGVNSFVLFKAKDSWRITYCIDTRQQP